MEVKFVELKQRHIEAWISAMPEDGGKIKAALYGGLAVRAAIKAGWVESPVLKVEDVDDMKPKEVAALANKVMSLYTESITVDPE